MEDITMENAARKSKKVTAQSARRPNSLKAVKNMVKYMT